MLRASSSPPEAQLTDDRFPTVRRQMPELEESLDEALEAGQSFELHDDFVEACEDYEACQRALADSALKDYAADFQDLSLEIEREIRRYLARYAGS